MTGSLSCVSCIQCAETGTQGNCTQNIFHTNKTGPNRARIFKRLRSPGIDSKESIPPAYEACFGLLNNLWGLGTDQE
jgi:hypothetical protein